MNIISINFSKLRNEIDAFILNRNADVALSQEACLHYNMPIVLMNEETYRLMQDKIVVSSDDDKIFGCRIAIARWLPFGEVRLK